MVRKHVASSSIRAIGYDSTTSTLEIEFAGGDIYAYYAVPAEMHERLMDSDSKGRFVNYEIKPNYPFAKIET